MVAAVPAHAGNPVRGLQRLFKDWGLFQGMTISGQNSLTLQENSIEGSLAAYEGQRWDTGTLVRRSSLHLEGPVWRSFGLQADISSSGWGPTYTRWVLGWTGQNTAVYFGDLNIRLVGNEFASFNKTLKGWQIDQRLPNDGLLRGFYSEEKGLTRNQTMPGNNTSGPYFLTYTPIIDGSEIVKVDEQLMRFGVDYRLDYEMGQLWFEPVDGPPRIIPSTSVISVSYQSAGWQSAPGELYGLRAQMPLADGKILLGLTGLKQDKKEAGAQADTVGYQEDIFQGSGSTGPFDVNYRPIIPNGTTVTYQGQQQVIEQALAVLVDNAEQVEGVDYDSYRQIGRIMFRRAVPPTALVIIQYYYDISTTIRSADNEVIGMDLGYRISDGLMLMGDYAQSKGGYSGGSGSAWRSSLQYVMPRLSATLELRDVNPGFSYLETVGFQRNEKGLNLAAQWEVNEYISVYERYSDLKSGQGLSFGYSGYSGGYGYGGGYGSGGGYYPYGVGTAQYGDEQVPTSLDVRTRRNDLGLDVRYPGWPTLSFARQTMSNRGGSRSNSKQTTDHLTLNYAPQGKPYSLSLNFSESGQNYGALSAQGEDDSLYTPRGSTTRQMQGSLTYTPSDMLSLSANLGHNRSSATESTSVGTSDMMQLSVRWTPSSRISLNVDHTMSESLGSVSSGFYGGGYSGGYTGGYGGGTYVPYQVGDGIPWNPGGGGTPGGGDDQEDTLNRHEDTNTRLNISYRPTSTLTLSLGRSQRTYSSGGSIGYLADSEQTSYNASAGWQPRPDLSLTAMVGSDEMRFLEEGRGAVINDMLALSANYRPLEARWGVGINLHRQTGSSPTYIGFGEQQISRTVPTNLLDISGQLTYQIGDGFSIYGRLGRAEFESGYANFDKDQGELGVSYRLSDLADFSLSYRYIRNISTDPDLPLPGYVGVSQQGQNYIAHTFMLGVTSTFQTGLGRTSTPGSGYTGYGAMDYGSGGYGLGMSNFGGYQAGLGGQYGSGLGAFGTGYGTGGYGMSGYRTRQYGAGSGFTGFGGLGDFSGGMTSYRGSSAHYYGSGRRPSGFETGLGRFEEGAAETQPGEGPQWTEEGAYRPPGWTAEDETTDAPPEAELEEPDLPEAPTWPVDDFEEWWQEDV